MTSSDQSCDILRRADQLHAARSVMDQTERAPRRLGVAEIVQFLNDPGRSLSMAEQRALFADPRLRADYRRLKSQAALVELPAMAAASAGTLNSRRFDGGTVNIHPSRVPGQVYVLLRFNWPGPPRTMLLESAGGDLVKRPLPAADTNGEVLMVLDQNRDADASFLELITDPTSTGCFLL